MKKPNLTPKPTASSKMMLKSDHLSKKMIPKKMKKK